MTHTIYTTEDSGLPSTIRRTHITRGSAFNVATQFSNTDALERLHIEDVELTFRTNVQVMQRGAKQLCLELKTVWPNSCIQKVGANVLTVVVSIFYV